MNFKYILIILLYFYLSKVLNAGLLHVTEYLYSSIKDFNTSSTTECHCCHSFTHNEMQKNGSLGLITAENCKPLGCQCSDHYFIPFYCRKRNHWNSTQSDIAIDIQITCAVQTRIFAQIILILSVKYLQVISVSFICNSVTSATVSFILSARLCVVTLFKEVGLSVPQLDVTTHYLPLLSLKRATVSYTQSFNYFWFT